MQYFKISSGVGAIVGLIVTVEIFLNKSSIENSAAILYLIYPLGLGLLILFLNDLSFWLATGRSTRSVRSSGELTQDLLSDAFRDPKKRVFARLHAMLQVGVGFVAAYGVFVPVMAFILFF